MWFVTGGSSRGTRDGDQGKVGLVPCADCVRYELLLDMIHGSDMSGFIILFFFAKKSLVERATRAQAKQRTNRPDPSKVNLPTDAAEEVLVHFTPHSTPQLVLDHHLRQLRPSVLAPLADRSTPNTHKADLQTKRGQSFPALALNNLL